MPYGIEAGHSAHWDLSKLYHYISQNNFPLIPCNPFALVPIISFPLQLRVNLQWPSNLESTCLWNVK